MAHMNRLLLSTVLLVKYTLSLSLSLFFETGAICVQMYRHSVYTVHCTLYSFVNLELSIESNLLLDFWGGAVGTKFIKTTSTDIRSRKLVAKIVFMTCVTADLCISCTMTVLALSHHSQKQRAYIDSMRHQKAVGGITICTFFLAVLAMFKI